ncbi:MAG: Eco57I restriction-modification methylase domain-containing protein [Candidatus Thorarchaeota archaeon]
MSLELKETAQRIISGFHRLLADQSHNSIEISEAVRLAGLTYTLSFKQLDDEYLFSKLAYHAERLGTSQRTVTELAREVLESFSYPVPRKLESEEIIELLGLVHSLGCYSLPLTYNEGTTQKPLGAFYTPAEIADYIVSLTISPTLNALASKASAEGISALDEILSLRTLDPACGTGIFLVSAMKAFASAMNIGIQNIGNRSVLKRGDFLDFLDAIQQNMYGVDIDSGALEVADISLRLLASPNEKELGRSLLGTSLKQGNSLISLKGLNGTADHSHFFADASSRYPFEWADEFGGIIENGGFDFILMNPPYERLKPNLAEFLRERLLSGERDIHLDNFSKHKEHLNEDLQYFRKSGEFHVGNKYSIDTHRLFIERTLQLASEGSTIGFIVPSTILGDISAQPLRSSLIHENRLLSVDDFPETSRLFDGVTQSVSIMTLQRGGVTNSFLARFGLNDINDARSRNHIVIPAGKIEKAVGGSLSIPQVDKVGWSLMLKMHEHPPISNLDWILVKRGELDLTLNRDCITNEETNHPLVRGSHISRYSLIRHEGEVAEFVHLGRLRRKLGKSIRAEHVNQSRLACQQVSNRTQKWRLKFSIIPPGVVLANSCNYLIFPEKSNDPLRYYLLGLLNSELLNWRFSLTNTNNHVSIRELNQLPIAEPNKGLRRLMIKEVKRIRTNGYSPKVEAISFAIYGFSIKDTKNLLVRRSTPKTETVSILNELECILT